MDVIPSICQMKSKIHSQIGKILRPKLANFMHTPPLCIFRMAYVDSLRLTNFDTFDRFERFGTVKNSFKLVTSDLSVNFWSLLTVIDLSYCTSCVLYSYRMASIIFFFQSVYRTSCGSVHVTRIGLAPWNSQNLFSVF